MSCIFSKKRILVPAGAILAVALAAGFISIRRTASNAVADGEALRRGDLLIEAPLSGSLVAARSVDITAPISNDPHMFKIAQMAPEGGQMKVGDTLMTLDTQEVDQKLTEYQAEMNKGREELQKRKFEYDAQLRDLRVRLEEARVRRETAKLKADVDPSLTSQLERRQFQIEFEQAGQEFKLLEEKLRATQQMSRAELQVLEDTMSTVRLRVERVQKLQQACVVKAPIAGTLIFKVLAENQKRKVGEQTCHHEVILQIPDLSTLRLEAVINESDAGRVRVGQPVRLKLDAMPDEKITGKIVSVGTVLRNRRADTPVKVVDAVVELDQKPVGIIPGMTATGYIEVEKATGVLLAPLPAVHERAERVFVQVRKSDGSLEDRAIRTGRRNQQFVEVVEGVKEGEKLVR